MKVCQICNEPIWDSEWPVSVDGSIKKFLCYYCYQKLRNGGNYRPRKRKQNELQVCDKCGEASDDIKEVGSEWLCEDCRSSII